MGVCKKIKMLVFRTLSNGNILRLRLKGVRVGKGCIVNKAPYVKLAPGSQIILGNNVTLTSNGRHNPLLEHRAFIRTMTPEAVVEMKNYSGMTGSRIVCFNRITIGEHTIIGANTLIYDSDGHTYSSERGWNTPRLQTGRPISIGNKCFIGTRCIILGGVTIGDNCVIAAGSVVTQDVPAGHRAYGNPAQVEPLPKYLGGPEATDTPKTATTSRECPAVSTDKDTILPFLLKVQEILELSFLPSAEDEFRNYEEWDSLAFLTLVAVLQDDYGIKLTSEDFNKLITWQDVYRRVNG